jgi:uncharacterized protein YbaR (Trm112 family)
LLLLKPLCYILARGRAPWGAYFGTDPELLAMLVCPVCKTPVQLTADKHGLRCSSCCVIYPIRDGFPVMIKEEALPEAG